MQKKKQFLSKNGGNPSKVKKFVLKNSKTRFQNAEARFQNAKTALLVWLVIAKKSSKNTMVWAYLGGGGKICEEDRRSSLLLVELDLEDFEARSASPPSGLLVRSNRPPRFP